MKERKISRKRLLAASAEVGPEDGRDPRLDRPESAGEKVANRKALQLCGQVARTLADLLAGEGDAVLRDLLVQSVVPAPNSSRLLVTLTPAPSAGAADVGQVYARLEQARGRLRTEVAHAIHRRKAPDLTFQVLAPGTGP